jgi:23S rRNA (cytidine1920-2'-O)/16S rRNA (cytidine1409-2'-O)-methyltransferase
MRLDRAVHARGLSRSRAHARELVESGLVTVDSTVVTKPAFVCAYDAVVAVAPGAGTYVSRAAFKLVSALEVCEPLGLSIGGRRALDAGASTGGFTQVLLERGVAHVHAVDVGHDQLADSIASDVRVTAVEGLNVRELTADTDGAGVSLVVADLSFISLTLVTPALTAFAGPGADFLLMVKPQFEVGRSALNKQGVVTSPQKRAAAVLAVVDSLTRLGHTIHHISRSGLTGTHGNVEFFIWSSSAWEAIDTTSPTRPRLSSPEVTEVITHAVKEDG